VVIARVLALRITQAGLDRPPGAGDLIVRRRRATSIFLMFGLPARYRVRLAVCLAIGLVIYFAYGMRTAACSPE